MNGRDREGGFEVRICSFSEVTAEGNAQNRQCKH